LVKLVALLVLREKEWLEDFSKALALYFFMVKYNSLLFLLKTLPVFVFCLTQLHPYSVIPIFISLFVVFLILLVKTIQEIWEEFNTADDAYLYGRDARYANGDRKYPFESSENEEAQKNRQIDFYIKLLDLTWPFTRKDLTKAYRRKARQTHPDVPGGSKQAFLQVREAYDKLQEYLQTSPTGK